MRVPKCRKYGKTIFPSSAAAEAELVRAQAARAAGLRSGLYPDSDADRVESRTFPCTACGGHHLTHEGEQDGAPVKRRRGRRR